MGNDIGSAAASMADATRQATSEDMRRYRFQQVIQVLIEAKKIRDNAALMAEIRVALRDERDRLGNLLDEVGA